MNSSRLLLLKSCTAKREINTTQTNRDADRVNVDVEAHEGVRVQTHVGEHSWSHSGLAKRVRVPSVRGPRCITELLQQEQVSVSHLVQLRDVVARSLRNPRTRH